MNLRTLLPALLAVGVMTFTSCKDEEKTEATPTQSEVQTNDNPKTTAALNPAHGEAGHRCDIPVGAPLDQAASTNNVQQNQATTSGNVSPVRVNGASNTPTKNPPHGQPGHDCAKPVGADL